MAPVGPVTATATAVLALLGGGGLWNSWPAEVNVPKDEVTDILNETNETDVNVSEIDADDLQNVDSLWRGLWMALVVDVPACHNLSMDLGDGGVKRCFEAAAIQALDSFWRIGGLLLIAWSMYPWIQPVALILGAVVASYIVVSVLCCFRRRCCARRESSIEETPPVVASEETAASDQCDHAAVGKVGEECELLEPVREGLKDVIDTLKQPAPQHGSMSGIMTLLPSGLVLQELFAILDKNGDGWVRKTELVHAARTDFRVRELLGIGDSLDQESGFKTLAAFEAMDEDRNGAVSWDELTSYMRDNGLITRREAGPGVESPLARSAVPSPARSRKVST